MCTFRHESKENKRNKQTKNRKLLSKQKQKENKITFRPAMQQKMDTFLLAKIVIKKGSDI